MSRHENLIASVSRKFNEFAATCEAAYIPEEGFQVVCVVPGKGEPAITDPDAIEMYLNVMDEIRRERTPRDIGGSALILELLPREQAKPSELVA